MDKVITVPTSYRVTLNNGDSAVFLNKNRYDDYEGRLLSGNYGVTTIHRTTLITPDNVLGVETFIEPNGCEHCEHKYDLHVGENACPKCGGRTFLPAVET